MRYWPAIVSAAAAIAVAVPVVHNLYLDESETPEKTKEDEIPSSPNAVSPNALEGIEIGRAYLGPGKSTAPAVQGRIAHLTLDSQLQRVAQALLNENRVRRGAVAVMDVSSGRILAYASRPQGKKAKDLLTWSGAPAGGLFKLVTAASLLDRAGLPPTTKQCFRDPGRRFEADDLIGDQDSDHWCPTIGEAMAREMDVPFARLALNRLSNHDLQATAGAFGFGFPLRFDLPVESSTLKVKDDDMALARLAMGDEHATLSVMQALSMVGAIANRGIVLRPVLVESVADAHGKIIYRRPPGALAERAAMRPATANAIREMMGKTISIGSAFRAFHDDLGNPALGELTAGGKTGEVDQESARYSWFAGFSPLDKPKIAVAALTVSRKGKKGKAGEIARDAIRFHFKRE